MLQLIFAHQSLIISPCTDDARSRRRHGKLFEYKLATRFCRADLNAAAAVDDFGDRCISGDVTPGESWTSLPLPSSWQLLAGERVCGILVDWSRFLSDFSRRLKNLDSEKVSKKKKKKRIGWYREWGGVLHVYSACEMESIKCSLPNLIANGP